MQHNLGARSREPGMRAVAVTDPAGACGQREHSHALPGLVERVAAAIISTPRGRPRSAMPSPRVARLPRPMHSAGPTRARADASMLPLDDGAPHCVSISDAEGALSRLSSLRMASYTACHDEVLRHVGLHCPPLAALCAKLWGALSAVCDAAIAGQARAQCDVEVARANHAALISRVEPQLRTMRGQAVEMQTRLDVAQSDWAEERGRSRSSAACAALAESEAAGLRVRLEAALAMVAHATGDLPLPPLPDTSTAAGCSGADNVPDASTAIASIKTLLEALSESRAGHASLIAEVKPLVEHAVSSAEVARAENALSTQGGASNMHLHVPRECESVGVQTTHSGTWGSAPRSGLSRRHQKGAAQLLLLPILHISPSAAITVTVTSSSGGSANGGGTDTALVSTSIVLPLEWSVLMSVFAFDRPVRSLGPAPTRRLLLQLLLEKASFDRAATPLTGLRLSLAQYVSEFFNHRFGLPALADQRVVEVLASVRAGASVGIADGRHTIVDLLCGSRGVGLSASHDGTPLLGQGAFDFITALLDDLKAGGAFGRLRPTSALGDNAGYCTIPVSLLLHLLRQRFAFAPRSFVARLSVAIALLPCCLRGEGEEGEGAPGAETQPPRVDLDDALRVALLGWVEQQVSYEARVAAVFDTYSRPGVPVSSIRSRDMGVTFYSSGPIDEQVTAALLLAATSAAAAAAASVAIGIIQGSPASRIRGALCRTGAAAAVACGVWRPSSLLNTSAVDIAGLDGWLTPPLHSASSSASSPILPLGAALIRRLTCQEDSSGSSGSSSIPSGVSGASDGIPRPWSADGSNGTMTATTSTVLHPSPTRATVSSMLIHPTSLTASALISGSLDFSVDERRRKHKQGGASKLLLRRGSVRGAPTPSAALSPSATTASSDPLNCSVINDDSSSMSTSLPLPAGVGLVLEKAAGAMAWMVTKDKGGDSFVCEAPAAPSPLSSTATASLAAASPPPRSHPPGWRPGLGIDGALSGLASFDASQPVFRPEDLFFADIDSHAEGRHVRTGTRPFAPATPNRGIVRGRDSSSSEEEGEVSVTTYTAAALETLSSPLSSSAAAAAAQKLLPHNAASLSPTLRAALSSPLTQLPSPVPSTTLTPHTIHAIGDALGGIRRALRAYSSGARASISRGRGSISRGGAPPASDIVTSVSSRTPLSSPPVSPPSLPARVRAAAAAPPPMPAGDAARAVAATPQTPLPRGQQVATPVPSHPTVLLFGVSALDAQARALSEPHALLAAARRSKRRISLVDAIDAVRGCDPWVTENVVRRAFEHARWRLEEAGWSLALAGWHSGTLKRDVAEEGGGMGGGGEGAQSPPPLARGYWHNSRTGATSRVPPPTFMQRVRVTDLDWASFVGMCVRAGFLRVAPGSQAMGAGGDAVALAAVSIQRWWRACTGRVTTQPVLLLPTPAGVGGLHATRPVRGKGQKGGGVRAP